MPIEIFPAALLAREKEDEVIFFLQQLPIPPRRRKQALIEWAKFVGAAMTEEMFDKLLGAERGRV